MTAAAALLMAIYGQSELFLRAQFNWASFWDAKRRVCVHTVCVHEQSRQWRVAVIMAIITGRWH